MPILNLRVVIAVSAVVVLGLVNTGSSQDVKDLYSIEWPFYVTPTQGRDGQLYATDSAALFGSCGDIFRITTSGAYTRLDQLQCDKGSNPYSGLTLATDGYYYGTMVFRGADYEGVLYRMDPTGTYTVLHNFAGGTDGNNAYAPPIEASDGNLYGTTLGDASTASTVYKYSPSSGTYTVLLQLQESDGASVYSPLVQGFDGNLYGIAYAGGANGVGTAFKLTTTGILLASYSFDLNNQNPIGPLLQAADGNFYGTTFFGVGCGTVYKMTPAGVISTLYSFPYGIQYGACKPVAGLVLATDGYLYGTTSAGGTYGDGTIFRITTHGRYQSLYSFPQAIGQTPQATLLQHTNGTFYGTTAYGGPQTYGVIYSFSAGAVPFITFVVPTGHVGKTVQILGQGLTGTTSVTFNGVSAASFKVVFDTYLTAVVPNGATTGPVLVNTPRGTLISNKNFRVSH